MVLPGTSRCPWQQVGSLLYRGVRFTNLLPQGREGREVEKIPRVRWRDKVSTQIIDFCVTNAAPA